MWSEPLAIVFTFLVARFLPRGIPSSRCQDTCSISPYQRATIASESLACPRQERLSNRQRKVKASKNSTQGHTVPEVLCAPAGQNSFRRPTKVCTRLASGTPLTVLPAPARHCHRLARPSTIPQCACNRRCKVLPERSLARPYKGSRGCRSSGASCAFPRPKKA